MSSIFSENIEPTLSDHDKRSFYFVVDLLGEYPQQFFLQHATAIIDNTYFAVDDKEELSFYDLSMFGIHQACLPAKHLGWFRNFLLPAAYFAQLAVAPSHKRKKLGGLMLVDALQSCPRLSGQIGAISAIVGTKDKEAKRTKNFVVRAGRRIRQIFLPCVYRFVASSDCLRIELCGLFRRARRLHQWLLCLQGLLFATPLLASPAQVFDCLIEPAQIVELASPVTGLLEKVYVKRADRVSKGQIVATLESRAEHAAAEMARFKSEQVGPTAMAENKIEFSKRKLGRRQVMTDEKLMAAQDRDDAEAELRLAESELKIASENRQIAKLEYQQQSSLLNLRTVRSPFDGVVVDQLAYPGEVVEPGSNKKGISKLAQLNPLRVQVVLPKNAFGKVSGGMEVEVQPEIPITGSYTAKVKSVDRIIDAASGTFVVLLEMPNPKLEIPVGVKCKASFVGMEVGAVRGPATDKRKGQ